MASTSALSRIPVLRILVPFVVGIIVHRLWHCWWAPLTLVCLSLIAYACLMVASGSPHGRLRWRPYFIVPLATIALSLGWLCAVIHCPPHLDSGQRSGRVLTGRVVSLDYTDFSMRMTLEVLDSDLPPCRVLVSTRGCDYLLRSGVLVSWPAHLSEVGNMGNPGEMDYAALLLNGEGIRYQQHLDLSKIHRTGHSPTLITRLDNIRREMCRMVYSSGLSEGAGRFVSALLLGERGVIDKVTRQEFSAAGVAHVLALSGLHVGIIALIIWCLLFPLDYLGLKKLRLAITLAAIILFAVFTGMTPSVVRATVMTGMVFAAFIFYRRAASLNALFLAALLILVFSPSALFSVGFQLSFITVGAILLFARLPEFLTTRHRWVNYLTSTAITSPVAMLATVAVSAYYFHTVSLMSVLSNLLILPVLPVFMALGALFLLVTAARLHWALLGRALDIIYQYIHGVTTAVNAIPGSHMSGVYVSAFGVIAYFAVLALVILWLYRRTYRYLLCAGVALAVLLGHSVWLDAKTPRRGLVIFNSFTSTPVLYYDVGRGYVWTPDDEETDSAAFARYYAGFLARQGINELHFIGQGETMGGDDVFIRPPYVQLMDRRLVAVGSGKWKSSSTSHRMPVDDVIVTKRYHGTAAKLQELYRFKRLVISGALYDKKELLNECDSLGIEIHDLSTEGAFSLTID